MTEEDDLRNGLRMLTAEPPPSGELATVAIGRARAHRARRRIVVIAAALVVAAGGSTAIVVAQGGGPAAVPVAQHPGGSAMPSLPAGTGPDKPAIGAAYPYQLYVHCGVKYARFGGRWWVATAEQSQPPAPPGRDGNYVSGTMTLVAADRARFQSTNPPVTADFRPAGSAPALCD